jgi:hypothetical protein
MLPAGSQTRATGFLDHLNSDVVTQLPNRLSTAPPLFVRLMSRRQRRKTQHTSQLCKANVTTSARNVLSRSDSRLSPASQREIAGKATISAPPERSIVKTRFRHISAYFCRECDIPALETRPAVGVGPGDLSKVDRTFTRHSRWRHYNMRPAVKVVRTGRGQFGSTRNAAVHLLTASAASPCTSPNDD